MRKRILSLFFAGMLTCGLISADVTAADAGWRDTSATVQTAGKSTVDQKDNVNMSDADENGLETEQSDPENVPAGGSSSDLETSDNNGDSEHTTESDPSDNDHTENAAVPEQPGDENLSDPAKPGEVENQMPSEDLNPQDTEKADPQEKLEPEPGDNSFSVQEQPDDASVTDISVENMKETGKIDLKLGTVKAGYTPIAYTPIYTNPTVAAVGGVAFDQILSASIQVIGINEGSYTAVNKNDNGALSIGKLQWHGTRALNLLRSIAVANQDQAYQILGAALFEEVRTGTYGSGKGWGTKTLNDSEAASIQKLLGTQEGKDAQDKLANSDVTLYINHGYNMGIVNPAALVYYADVENQWGQGGASNCANYSYRLVGNWGLVTLNELHMGTVCYTYERGGYYSRRHKTYNSAAALGWTYCNSGDLLITSTQWLQTALNIYQNAGLTVDGSYGTATQNAVRAFQQSAGIAVDGSAGAHTYCALIFKMYYQKALTGLGDVVVNLGTYQNPVVGTKETVITTTKNTYSVNDTKGSFSLSTKIKSNHSESGFSFQSSNPAVAAVDSSGKVSVLGVGTATITISQAATANYKAAKKTVKVKVYSTNPSSYKVPAYTLKAGKTMSKTYVQWVQAALIQYGYTTEVVDGKWDSTTTAAVKKFQTAANMTPDGSVGPGTRGALKNLLDVRFGKTTTKAASGTDRNTVSWNRVSGVSGYNIYRKEPGGKWKKIKAVSSGTTSYSDKTAQKGVIYYYAVRGYRKYGNILQKTAYKASGKTVRLAKTKISVKNGKSAVRITWNKVSSATGYVVYRKVSGQKWVKLSVQSATTFKDKSVQRGVTYYYCVKAYKKKNGVTAKGPKSSAVKGRRTA